jgi:hypothetical protein
MSRPLAQPFEVIVNAAWEFMLDASIARLVLLSWSGDDIAS